jgi:pyruvate dehydrogenase E2 component (dihydrolipoamide acetyltransferase)
MAKFEFKLPDIGEGVTEGEIVSWLVAVGDVVAEDQEMVEVMTDKATVTIGAPKAGRIAEVKAAVGDVVAVGSTVVVLELDVAAAAAGGAAAKSTEPAKSAASAVEAVASAVGDLKEDLPGTPGRAAAQPESAPVGGSGPALAAPATRKLARELGVDLGAVAGSGSAGRITREDVEAHARRGAAVAPPSVPAALSALPTPASPAPAPMPVSPPVAAPADRRIPIRGMRKRIAENMARSKRTAAHFAYADEVSCDALIALRERTRAHAEAQGVKLTYLPFIVKATVAALRKHPALNSWVDDANGEIIEKANCDIGIATATEAGLVVPVLRNADRLSILQIAREIGRMAAEAKDGKVSPKDLGGSTFTVTSLGRLGGLFSTPVVNYPEVGIMGVHEMKRRPIVVGDEIRIGHVMLLALSFDHRIIDGHVGAAFAQEVKALLEDPDRLLLEMT